MFNTQIFILLSLIILIVLLFRSTAPRFNLKNSNYLFWTHLVPITTFLVVLTSALI